MKTGKLYIKIFLSFMALLIISEILIFGLFHFITERTFHEEFKQYLNGTASIFKNIVEEKLNNKYPYDIENAELEKFITMFSNTYRLKIRVESPDRKTASFSDRTIPVISEKDLKKSGDFYYKINRKRNGFVYLKVPIKFFDNSCGNIYIYRELITSFHKIQFVAGLAIIGLCIAILLYPFSRYIAIPLKRLTESADEIAKGNLSQRVKIRSRDEIGRLAKSFNSMAGTIEGMVKGTKELTANISHELRSPLTRIRVAEEMLAGKIKGKDSQADKLLNSIEGEIDEMDNLIGQILLLSGLDLRKEATKEEINITKLVEEIIDKYKAAFEEKSINIFFEKIETSCMINAVRDDIKKAFSNLIDNAVKYTEENGKVNVNICKNNGSVEIVIFNTCRHFSKEELLNMFRPFCRMSSDAVSGSGLGLSITKKIVENHGGFINFLSKDNGLTVNIVLPVG